MIVLNFRTRQSVYSRQIVYSLSAVLLNGSSSQKGMDFEKTNEKKEKQRERKQIKSQRLCSGEEGY